MISRSTLIGALVVVELAIAGVAVRAIAGGGAGPGAHVSGWGSHWPAGTSSAYGTKRLDASIPTGATPHVTIDVDDVRVIVQAAGESATVHAVESLRTFGWTSSAPAPIRAERTADGVRITMADRGSVRVMMGGYSRTLTVTVPQRATLEVTNGDGSITASGLRSGLTARTGDGAIRMSDLRGSIDVHTGDGSITAVDVQGPAIRLETSDGRVRLDRVVADRLDGNTGDGSIEGLAVHVADGALGTKDGRIRIAVTPDSDATVNLHTGDGRISLDDGMTTVSSNPDDGDAHTRVVRLGTGRGRFEISSGDGSISLTQGAKV
jgi:hypothetical protein